MTGQTISHYKILATIAEDATGILYKAADTESGQAVVLKTLSPGMMARIERASALEHPNFARVVEISRSGEIEFAVFEAATGESIYDFLERERPPRAQLLRYSIQLASALAAMHEAGIVHGPLNAAAIFLTPQQQIRMYDFGSEGPATESGAAAPYVSPEQTQGQPPDVRSDIFSFGALVYHLTTGRPAFQGWKAIRESKPTPVVRLTSRAPRGMDKLLERCLQKNPRRRFRQMREIEPLIEKMLEVHNQNPEYVDSLLSRYRGPIVKIAGLILAASAAVAVAVRWTHRQHASPARELLIGSAIRQLSSGPGFDTDPAISADGSLLAYASDRKGGNLDIWAQPADGGEPAQLTNDPADDREPAFSPDGATIAFRSERNGGGVYVVPSKGGEARLIAPEGRRPRFSPDGRSIAYWVGPPGLAPKVEGAYKVFVVPAGGGAPRRIRPDFASGTLPIWSPDGKSLLFMGRPDFATTPNSGDWFAASAEGDRVVNTRACLLFHREGILPPSVYGIPGDWKGAHIYFSAPELEGSSIWRADIDPDSLTVSTNPVKVTRGEGIEILPYAAAKDRLVFSREALTADIWGIPVLANEGKVTGSLKRWTRDPGINVSPSLSADGSRLLFQSNRTGHYNIWSAGASGGKESVEATAAQDQLWPIVSPDGSKVAWSEGRIGRYEQFYKPTAGGATQVLCEDCGPSVSGWSSDGRMALVDVVRRGSPSIAVGLIKLGVPGKTVVLEDPAANLRHAHFSPDDRSIVFVARLVGGSTRIYIAPLRDRPAPAKEWIALTDGNAWETAPQWSPDGKLVYYISTRDGFRCVWAQPLNAANKPAAAAFAVYHFHSAPQSPAKLPGDETDLFVGRNQILVSLGELTGKIWGAKVPQ